MQGEDERYDIQGLGILLYALLKPIEELKVAENLSEYISHLHQPHMVELVKRSISSCFTQEEADHIFNLAANKTIKTANREQTGDGTEVAWQWLTTSNNIKDILRFGLQELRKYFKSQHYRQAIEFNNK